MSRKTNKRLAALGIAGILATSSISFSSLKVYASVKKEPIKIVKDISQFKYNSPHFLTREEAEKWLLDKEKMLKEEYDIISKDVITLDNHIISTSKVPVYYTFESLKEAIDKKQELEKEDIHTSNLNIVEQPITVVEVNKIFPTKEEALIFIASHNDKQDVKLDITEIYKDWTSSGKKTVKELSGLTKAELEQELKNIEQHLENSATDILKYKIFITNTFETEQIYLKDEVTKNFETFSTLEEANKYIENLKAKETTNIKIEITGPTSINKLVDSKNYSIDKTFSTLEEANKYLETLEKEGYILSDIKKEKVQNTEMIKVPTGNIIVNNSNKLDSNSYYEVKGNYLMIKQASGKVVIWTENELTEEEKNSFKNSWFKGNYDSSVSKDFDIYFIYGEGTKDLSYIGKQWGIYNITCDNDIIRMTCDKDRISHLNYGNFEEEYKKEEQIVTKYQVTGLKTMNIYEKEYQVNHTKTEKIYKNQTTYGALVEAETFVRDKNYQALGTYKSEKPSWILEGNYHKNNRGQVHYAVIKVNKKESVIEEPYPYKEDLIMNKKQSVESNNPDTADNNNIAFYLGLAALSAGAVTTTLVRKRRY